MALAGNAKAQYIQGVRYEKWGLAPDPRTAVSFYEKSARQGFAPAQHRLAIAYLKGIGGLTANPQAAFEWEKKAAEQGFAPAQNELGLLYQVGRGVAKDYKQAAAWHRKAAERNFPQAMHYLGLLHKTGRGVGPPNIVLAYQWHAAERMRSRRPCTDSAFLRKLLKPQQISAAEKAAAAFLKKHPAPKASPSEAFDPD